MQNIGLLMTYNEEDCIEEVMREHAKYFDKILVLDGSTDRTPEIIRSFKNVVYFAKDQDVLPGVRITDSARQVLIDEAQKRYGCEGWFTLLHGDEIFHDNPNTNLALAEQQKADRMHWYAMQFFLHTSDAATFEKASGSVQEKIRWYCPGFVEIRQFRNKPGIKYAPGQHGRVFPDGLNGRLNLKFPVYKHYAYRSVSQMQKKVLQNQKTHFGGAFSQVSDASPFIEKLPGYKQARRFDGDFREFELKNQKHLIWRALNNWRYR